MENFPWITGEQLEEFKHHLGIPLKDTSQDARLLHYLARGRVLLEAYLGQRYGQKGIEWKGPPAKEGRVNSTIALIKVAFREVLKYELAMENSAFVEQEGHELQSWLAWAVEQLQEDPKREVRSSRDFALIRTDTLSCLVRNRVTLSFDARLPEIIEAFSIPLGQDVVAFLGWELLLRCTKGAGANAKQMDVIVWRGGKPQRRKISKRVVKLIFPHAHKRLYLPRSWETLSEREIRAWTQDSIALMSLYLIQAGLISLDEDQDVQQFLLSYLSGFRRAAQVGAASVLAEILTHYRLPEDYRAWRKYVGKTIKGLVATQKRQDRTIGVSVRRIGPLMIPEVAGRVGLSRETLYRQVRRGQVRAEKVNVGTVSYLALSDTEVEQLKKEQEQKQLRKALIAAWANKQGISKHSARQWVRRQERQGLGIKEMSEKIGREWLKRAVHSLSQESKV